MKNFANIMSLCEKAREKGLVINIRYDGKSLEFYHQESGSHEIILSVTAYKETGLLVIEGYLKGLV